MATLAVTTLSQSGAVPSPVAAAGGGDSFPNTGREYLQVTNGDVSSKTVTINSVQACNQGFDHDLVVTVAAGDTKLIGPFPVRRFSSTVAVSYSAVTSVTVAVIKV